MGKLIALVLIVHVGIESHAGCLKRSKETLEMCKSNAQVQGLQKDLQEVIKKINPANGRMSPESCQGLSEAYSKFKALTEKYIDSCWGDIDDTDATCTEEIQTDKSIQKVVEGADALKTWRKAHEEAPKLEQYLKPMDELKARLDDCLRDAKGKQLVNSNTNRGNADTGGTVALASPKASPLGGEPSQFRPGYAPRAQTNQELKSGKGGSCLDLQGHSRGGPDCGEGHDSTSSPIKKLKAANLKEVGKTNSKSGAFEDEGESPPGLGKNLGGDLGGGVGELPGVKAGVASGTLSKIGELQRRLVKANGRSPSSNSPLLGISGAHSNLFFKVRIRYQHVQSRNELY